MIVEDAEKSSPVTVALALIDVINDFDFPEARQLLEHALPAARNLAVLKRQAQELRIPVVYLNDNFGRWRSDFRAQVQHCQREECLGKEIAHMLAPDEDDYFVLKPRHSGFYSTTLELLLRHLGVKTLILTGVATNICVLFTAHDAYMRGFSVVVPADCSASNTQQEHEEALRVVATACKAATPRMKDLDLAKLLRGHGVSDRCE